MSRSAPEILPQWLIQQFMQHFACVFLLDDISCENNLIFGVKAVLQLFYKPSSLDRYGFFEADTDVSAIHGPIYRPIRIFPKFLNLVKSGFIS